MDCSPEPGAPTFVGELQRGVNPFNLGFGALATLALLSGLGMALLYSPQLQQVTGPLHWSQLAYCGLGLFALITVIHTLAHAVMGWVFERGLRLHCQGHLERAEPWLRWSAQPGMDHYDPNGVALAAWRDCQDKKL